MIRLSGLAGSLPCELEVDRLNETGPTLTTLLFWPFFDSESFFDLLEGSARIDHGLHFSLLFFDGADEVFDIVSGLGIGMTREEDLNPGRELHHVLQGFDVPE